MHIAQSWRLKGQRYALKGTKCECCQQVIFPPREVCPYCQSVNQTTNREAAESDRIIVVAEAAALQPAAR